MMIPTETIQEQRRRPGRPKKGEARQQQTKMHGLHVEVSPDGADTIARLARRLGVSQGAAIEYAARMIEQHLCNAA